MSQSHMLALISCYSQILEWAMRVQIEKVMKALFVRKLYLWPRFEVHVKDSLNDLPIEARIRDALPET